MIFTNKQKTIIDRMKKKYSVKNLKTFRGMEGTGVNSTLYENGKKLCNVDDEGNGGCLLFYDWNVEKKINEELKNVGKVKYDPTGDETDNWTHTYDAEMFLNDIISEALENRDYKRKCKTKTLVITKECGSGQFIEWKHTYNELMKIHLEKTYGNDLVEIINERFI